MRAIYTSSLLYGLYEYTVVTQILSLKILVWPLEEKKRKKLPHRNHIMISTLKERKKQHSHSQIFRRIISTRYSKSF